jgi:UDP-N-acetylglucosamine 2-epimerase
MSIETRTKARRNRMRLMLVVGARPQIIRSAPIIREAPAEQWPKIMEEPEIKTKLKRIKNPFGDGHASQGIISEILESW